MAREGELQRSDAQLSEASACFFPLRPESAFVLSVTDRPLPRSDLQPSLARDDHVESPGRPNEPACCRESLCLNRVVRGA